MTSDSWYSVAREADLSLVIGGEWSAMRSAAVLSLWFRVTGSAVAGFDLDVGSAVTLADGPGFDEVPRLTADEFLLLREVAVEFNEYHRPDQAERESVQHDETPPNWSHDYDDDRKERCRRYLETIELAAIPIELDGVQRTGPSKWYARNELLGGPPRVAG